MASLVSGDGKQMRCHEEVDVFSEDWQGRGARIDDMGFRGDPFGAAPSAAGGYLDAPLETPKTWIL
jgi:hypothetical protein